MAKNLISSSFPEIQIPGFNGKPFILLNGKKFIEKMLKAAEEELQILLSFHKGGSGKMVKEAEKTHESDIRTLKARISNYKEILKYPVRKTFEQKKFFLEGNGAKITLNGQTLFVVMDGYCVNKHSLPGKLKIISSFSPLGKAMRGKRAGEAGSYKIDEKVHSFRIERIHLPSESKWLFKYFPPSCSEEAEKEKEEASVFLA